MIIEIVFPREFLKAYFTHSMVMLNILQCKEGKRLARLDLFEALAFGSGLKIGLDGQRRRLPPLYSNIL